MESNIQKAIELGKIWMKNSINPTHDFNHANRVEQHAVEIYNEIKPKNISLDVVKLAVWWHDCYKARCKKVTLDNIWNEGVRSSKIFLAEVGPLLDFKTMSLVSKAIINHNRGLHAMLNSRKLDTLSMILIEADQLDGLNSRRNNKELKNIKNPFVYFFDRLLTAFVPMFILSIRRSKYSKNKLREYIKKK